MTQQPLAGIKVLDFTTLLPGPLAALMLSESGADVIKIEPPGGDGLRHMGSKTRTLDARFALLNGGKRCIEADLKDEKTRDALLAMIGETDVVVEQFRPGVMDRLGFGYDALSAINPRLIYCSITGYGQDGPLSPRAGHDLNYLADAGVLALGDNAHGVQYVPPVLAADIAGGSYPAFFNILLALLSRAQTGKGQYIDVAMTEGMFPFAFWAFAQGWGDGQWPGPGQGRLTGGSPRYRVYSASDGKSIAVGALEEKFWISFCDAIGLAEELRPMSADPGTVIEAVSELIAARPSAHWDQAFAKADCCCNVAVSLEDAVRSPHFAARHIFERKTETEDGQLIPSLPLPIMPDFRRPLGSAAMASMSGDDKTLAWRPVPVTGKSG